MAKKTEVPTAPKGDMTPMIDMVFQLLIFFLLMFKIVIPEGDFSIRMPIGGGPSDGEPPQAIVIELLAYENGDLKKIRMGNQEFEGTRSGLEQLAHYARKQLAGTPLEAAATEIELACDYNLKYSNVIRIITLTTGYIQDGKIVKLAERIKFRPPRKPA